jgi:hypothetical protein
VELEMGECAGDIDKMMDHIHHKWSSVVGSINGLINCGRVLPNLEDRPVLAHKINELIMSINSYIREPRFISLRGIFDKKMDTIDDLREGNLSWNLCSLHRARNGDSLQMIRGLSNIMDKYSSEIELLTTMPQ